MTRRRGPARRDDRGSAAVLVTVLAGALLVLTLAGSVLGGLLVGQRRAASAADLAALAGAEALGPRAAASGSSAACDAVRRVGEANGARLEACHVEGSEILVHLVVEVESPVGAPWEVSGRARAGPAGAGPAGQGPSGP